MTSKWLPTKTPLRSPQASLRKKLWFVPNALKAEPGVTGRPDIPPNTLITGLSCYTDTNLEAWTSPSLWCCSRLSARASPVINACPGRRRRPRWSVHQSDGQLHCLSPRTSALGPCGYLLTSRCEVSLWQHEAENVPVFTHPAFHSNLQQIYILGTTNKCKTKTSR